MNLTTTASRLLVVAGEPSGDEAAARVVDDLRLREPSLEVFGIGGEAMASSGVELIAHIDQLTGMGILDGARHAFGWARAWAALRTRTWEKPPNCALLVDSPDINLPLARALKEEKVPVVNYIAPQVWAWRPQRLGLLAKRVDECALVLPFEEPLFRSAGVPCQYVGHPLLDRAGPVPREIVRERLGCGDDEPLVALLCGSRTGEVIRLAPVLDKLCAELSKRGVRFVWAPGPGRARRSTLDISTSAREQCLPADFVARDALAAADCAIVASGTATLEAALCETPMTIVYRTDPLTYAVARKVLKIPFAGLPNWILERPEIPELFQRDVNPLKLVEKVEHMLQAEERDRQRRVLQMVKAKLGRKGAARRVADMVLERL